MTVEKKNANIYFNFIFFVSAIIISILIPWIFKLNRNSFLVGFVTSILIINFSIFYLKNYFYDESWYTEQYQYNNTTIYKETFKDIIIDVKEGVINGFNYIFAKSKSKGVK